MARGDKSSYSDKQKRQARDIEQGYEKRGVGEKEAERRAWATVNKMTGGGKKAGAGRGKKVNKAPARKGGRLGGAATAARPAAARSASAKKAAQTRGKATRRRAPATRASRAKTSARAETTTRAKATRVKPAAAPKRGVKAR